MRKQISRFLGLLLAFVLTVSLAAPACPAAAADAPAVTAETAACALNALGLFKGTANGFELERGLTRAEAVTMMVRLLGMERASGDREWEHPFTDVPTWAQGYVGYAYESGLTNGVGGTRFAPNAPATAQMYLTFVLRALGYEDNDAGTVWSRWKTLAEGADLLKYAPDLEHFTRADAVLISWAAMDAHMSSKNSLLSVELEVREVYTPMQKLVSEIIVGSRTVTKTSKLDEIAALLYAGALREGVAPDIAALNQMALQNQADYLRYYLGLERLYFKEGIVCEPQIDAVAHSVVLFRLQDERDAAQVIHDIKNGVDPRKWIHVGVSPENVFVEQVDDLILLVMDDACGAVMANAFRQLGKLAPEKSGYYCVDGSYMEAGAPTDAASTARFAAKLTSLKQTYFPANNTLCILVPDKSFYAADALPVSYDHTAIAAQVKAGLQGWNVLDAAPMLELDDYCLTDSHWRQDALFDVVASVQGAFGTAGDANAFVRKTVNGFSGCYSGGDRKEELVYLASLDTDRANVKRYDESRRIAVYDTARMKDGTGYDFFLGGASAMVTISNASTTSSKKLVILGDSFAYSLAPLLTDAYGTITLVDLRLTSVEQLGDQLDFKDADVLCLFCDDVMNSSQLLK